MSAANGAHVLIAWVDPDLCTGDANCATNVPEVFEMHAGLAYIVGDTQHQGTVDHIREVPAGREEAAIDEAEECPGECIYVENAIKVSDGVFDLVPSTPGGEVVRVSSLIEL